MRTVKTRSSEAGSDRFLGSDKTGTKFTFFRMNEIFLRKTVFDYDIREQRFREMAFLTAGLKIVLRDTREGIDRKDIPL